MLKLYCYNRCSTCKKALKWLDDKGIAYEATDIKTDHPDEETLRKYYSMSGLPLNLDSRINMTRLAALLRVPHIYQPAWS